MEKLNKCKASLERTRRIILSVASELLVTEGFKSTSIREIALKANITQSNLYHHSRDKKEPYLAVIEELAPRVQEELVPAVSGNASVEKKLYQLIKVSLDERPTDSFLVLNDIFQEMGPDHNRTLYQIFKKTYINNTTAISEDEPETNCLQGGISADDVIWFILHSVSVLLGIERTYQRRTVDDDVKKFIQFMPHGTLRSHK